MINLIPPQAKKNILTEYWLRVTATWLYLSAFTFVCSAAIIFPAYILVTSQVAVYEETAALASAKVADYQSASVGLVRSSQQATAIVDESRIKDFSGYITLLESLQGNTIEISRMDIKRSKEGVAPIQLVGVASDRQSLASFRDRLLEQLVIDEVDLPIANLAQDRDIQFNLKVVINNEIKL